MTEPDDIPAPSADAAPDDAQASDPQSGRRPGERLAKAIARAGLGSRREAEAWIEQGRVAVNGETVSTPNVNVEPGDRVEVDGRALPERERTRLWLYHKPRGYVTTTHDPEGRETVFSILPESMPRVMTVGRLDINTEGLLLLTNDGGLARVLELPETGWLRRYRVRAFGRTDPGALEKLKDGVEIDGFAYGAIDAEIERQQKDNVWLRFGLREGKNREVKRVAEHLGLAVNRLIRISFGPFQLGDLPEGGVEEVRTRTLIDQLGKRLAEEAGCDFEAPAASFGEDAPRKTGGRGGAGRPPAEAPERRRVMDPSQRVGRRAPIARPRDMPAPASAGEADAPETRTKRGAPIADRRGREVKVERVTRADPDAAPKRFRKKDDSAAERFGASGRAPRPGKPARDDRAKFDKGSRPGGGDAFPRDKRFGPKPDGDRPRRAEDGAREERGGFDRFRRPDAAERPAPGGARVSNPRWREDTGDGARERPSRPPREGAARPRPDGDRQRSGRDGDKRSFGDKRPFGRPAGDRPSGGARGDRPWADKGDRDQRPPRGEGRPPRRDGAGADRAAGDRPYTGRPSAGKPSAGKPFAGKPSAGARPSGGKPGGGKPFGGKPSGARPSGGKPSGGPRGPRPGGGGPKGGGKGRPGGADRRR